MWGTTFGPDPHERLAARHLDDGLDRACCRVPRASGEHRGKSDGASGTVRGWWSASRVRPRHGWGRSTLRNRIIKAATFEGATPRGEVTDRLIDFHRAVAAGGVGDDDRRLLRGLAGRPGAPALPGARRRRRPGLRRLTDAVHAEGARRPRSSATPARSPTPSPTGRRSLAPSRRFSPPAKGVVPAATPRRPRARPSTTSHAPPAYAVERRLRRRRGAPRPQLPAELVPQPEAQPAQGRATAARSTARARFPREVVARGPRRGRRPRRGDGEVQHGRRRRGRAVAGGEPPGRAAAPGRRPRSTRSSSPAAARC